MPIYSIPPFQGKNPFQGNTESCNRHRCARGLLHRHLVRRRHAQLPVHHLLLAAAVAQLDEEVHRGALAGPGGRCRVVPCAELPPDTGAAGLRDTRPEDCCPPLPALRRLSLVCAQALASTCTGRSPLSVIISAVLKLTNFVRVNLAHEITYNQQHSRM